MVKIPNSIYEEALEYHQRGRKGKIEVIASKPLVTQKDLSLAYSPGVAAPCLEITKDIENAYKYTAKGNLVAVITNGTAVLGLGNLGPSAAKPVMEGKAVLFKKFADIDAVDIEVDTEDAEEFINSIKYLGKSWGGINLEDIRAPECFIIEEKLKEILDIPVFHDDQHGTAIIASAGLINAAYLTDQKLSDLKIVVNGAGAAALACIDLIIAIGADAKKVILVDTKGVVYNGRTAGMNQWKQKFSTDSAARTLEEALTGANVLLGLSVKGAVTASMVKSMAKNPIIFAMANPDPEITPEEIKSVRDDAIIATGRSDYDNQVNNVMGFPYIFRGALDVRATTINQEMKIAATFALADLARQPVPEEVYDAYPDRKMYFGKEYIIPVPFDPRLITTIPMAVAKAAITTGVAKITEFDEKKYKSELATRLNPASAYMNLIFEKISAHPKKIVFAEGEEEEIIKAALLMRDNMYGYPIIIGREERILATLNKISVKGSLEGIQIVNAALVDNLEKYINLLYGKLQRKGYLYRDCARLVKTDRNIFAACMVECGDADALVTGLNKSYSNNLEDILKVISPKADCRILSYSLLLSKKHNIIIADNSICERPTAQDLVEIALQSASIASKLGLPPRVALLSFSNFGNPMRKTGNTVREAMSMLNEMKLDFEYDGEMSPDVALNSNLTKLYPFIKLSGPANVLIMPGLHSASISTKLMQEFSSEKFIGPILNGFSKPVQIVSMDATASEILNIATFAASEAINN